MNQNRLDLDTDYLSVTFGYATATGLSNMLDSGISHCDIISSRFNVVELVPEGNALQQIKDKGYADKYRGKVSRFIWSGLSSARTAGISLRLQWRP
ncbi:MAG: hypothetical protein R3E95_04700 [Thiolinea sp.]